MSGTAQQRGEAPAVLCAWFCEHWSLGLGPGSPARGAHDWRGSQRLDLLVVECAWGLGRRRLPPARLPGDEGGLLFLRPVVTFCPDESHQSTGQEQGVGSQQEQFLHTIPLGFWVGFQVGFRLLLAGVVVLMCL